MHSKLIGLSQKLWERSEPTFEMIKKTPLVTGLIKGLSAEEFHRFTQQDIYYLEQSFQPAIHQLYQKAKEAKYTKHQQLYSDFITATETELEQLKKQMSSIETESSMQPSEVCENYGNHLLETTRNQAYSIGIAACLPCFLFFPALGLYIKQNVEDLDSHPQKEWIKVYAEELFDNAYYMASLANEVISLEDEENAVDAYLTSAQHELSFFKDALEIKRPISCYRLE